MTQTNTEIAGSARFFSSLLGIITLRVKRSFEESEVEITQHVVGKALPGLPSQDNITGQTGTEQPVRLVASSDGAIVSNATPLPVQAGRVALRRRFLIIRGKNPMRCGIYREDVLQTSGAFKRVQRCVVLGQVSGVSERAAWKLFQPHLDRLMLPGNYRIGLESLLNGSSKSGVPASR
jgi:hypothetical protein